MSQDLFKVICATIRKERLYADIDLMREDIMQRFSLGRHRLNDLLTNKHITALRKIFDSSKEEMQKMYT